MTSEKKKPPNKAIIGNFALHGTKGVSMTVNVFCRFTSITLADDIAGTEHPVPTINGTRDFPLNPIAENSRSKINAARVI